MVVIHQNMVKGWSFQLHHMLHEGNMCTDFLAKLGAKSCNELMVMTNRLCLFRRLFCDILRNLWKWVATISFL